MIPPRGTGVRKKPRVPGIRTKKGELLDRIKTLPKWAQGHLTKQAGLIAEYQKEVTRHRRANIARSKAQAGVKTPLQVQEERITQLEVRARLAEVAMHKTEITIEQQVALNDRIIAELSRHKEKAKEAKDLSDRVTSELSRNRAELSRHKEVIGVTWKDGSTNMRRIIDLDTSHLRNIVQGGFADDNGDVVRAINAELKRRDLSAKWREKQGRKDDTRQLKGHDTIAELRKHRKLLERREDGRRDREASKHRRLLSILTPGRSELVWRGREVMVCEIKLNQFNEAMAHLRGLDGSTVAKAPLDQVENAYRSQPPRP